MDSSEACAQCQSNFNVKVCARCKSTLYCSKECQVAHWKTHKRSCEPLSGSNAPQNVAIQPTGPTKADAQLKDGRDPDDLPGIVLGNLPLVSATTSSSAQNQIWGVKLHHDHQFKQFTFTGPKARFVPELFDPSHPIFTSGERCTFTALYGVPIILYSPAMTRRQDAYPNQPAVYLRIEPMHGFAPYHWQFSNAGTCYAVRQDRKPLAADLLETMYEFHSYQISDWEDVPGRTAARITPAAFKTFSDKYWEEQKRLGRVLPSSVDGSDGS